VDIQGADLLIQRRITSQNILDPDQPRLGVVQAKFFESEATTQYIDRGYLEGKDGKSHSEFFLMCFTGAEDHQLMAFLKATEVLSNCREALGDKAGKYALPFKTVFNDRFVVTSRPKTLDRIEESLKYADITSNRRFISSGLTGGDINPHIDPLFEEPIDNPTAPIPVSFKEFKLMANSAMFEIEDMHRLLSQIVASSDPESAVALFKKAMHSNYCNGLAESFRGSEYLEDAIQHHKEVHEELTRSGIMGPYFTLQDAVRTYVVSATAKELKVPEGTTRVLTVTYDETTLTPVNLRVSFEPKEKVTPVDKYSNVVASEPGSITVCSGCDFLVTKRGRREPEVVDLPPEEHAAQCAWILARPVMDEVYRHCFGHPPGFD